jgi:hypothetical protein
VTRNEELAWAAGVLDAKGYAYRHGRYRRTLRLTDTRPELLDRFADIVGVGKVKPRTEGLGSAVLPQWRWEIYSRAAIEDVLALLDDYLASEVAERLQSAAGVGAA